MPCGHLALQQPYYYGQKLKYLWTRITENNSSYSGLPLPWIFNCCAKGDQSVVEIAILQQLLQSWTKLLRNIFVGWQITLVHSCINNPRPLPLFFVPPLKKGLFNHPTFRVTLSRGEGEVKANCFPVCAFHLFVCFFQLRCRSTNTIHIFLSKVYPRLRLVRGQGFNLIEISLVIAYSLPWDSLG